MVTNFFFKKINFNFFKFLKRNKSGRNCSGKITVRHRGGSTLKKHKKYFNVNYKNNYFLLPGVIIKIAKNNNNYVGLVKFINGCYVLIKLAHGSFYGDVISSIIFLKQKLQIMTLGSAVLIKNLTALNIFYNLLLENKIYSQYARSPGTFCQLIDFSFFKNLVLIELPTKNRIWISGNSVVLLGRNANINLFKEIIGKAGLNRHKNIRPTTRGVAMNPVDHPHGGRTKTNKPEVTPWGKTAKFNK